VHTQNAIFYIAEAAECQEELCPSALHNLHPVAMQKIVVAVERCIVRLSKKMLSCIPL